MGNSLTKNFRIAGHEVGPGGEVRPSTLLDYLQEIAGDHASTWKLSVTDLLPQGRTWVLARYHLAFHRFPGVAEDVVVETWPSNLTRMFAMRDFQVDDASGLPVLRASSSWAMLDLSNRKPMLLDKVVPADYKVDRHALVTTFPPLPKVEVVDQEVRLPVTLRDLDMNVHVNHVVYVQWALETIPLPLFLSHRLSSLEVAYRAEARHGHVILSQRSPAVMSEDGTACFAHAIVHAETGTELTRLRTTWTAREQPLALPGA